MLQAATRAGVGILTGAVTSPTLAHQIQELLARLPRRAGISTEPLARDSARRGARLAYGEMSMCSTTSTAPTWCCRSTPIS